MEVEKGLEVVAVELVVEKGLAEDEDGGGFAPKSDAPMLTGTFSCDGCDGCDDDVAAAATGGSAFMALVIRTPRNARTLPSFRRQAFRRHVKTYRRRS